MALSLYDASIPGYLRMLRNVIAMLDKAQAWAGEQGLPLEAVMEARLAPDMFPLTRQVQIVSDAAKGGAARLAGIEPPSFPDTEATWAELKGRLEKTVAFVEGVEREQVDGQEERVIEMRFPGRTMTFTGRDFLLTFSLPNFHFHVTVVYALLRAQGVPLGKMDYLAEAAAG
ncbi:MAG TPA: DUF1993 domain-containing protein [Caulobacteraceae bacterium]|jgi:hypothetical protein